MELKIIIVDSLKRFHSCSFEIFLSVQMLLPPNTKSATLTRCKYVVQEVCLLARDKLVLSTVIN